MTIALIFALALAGAEPPPAPAAAADTPIAAAPQTHKADASNPDGKPSDAATPVVPDLGVQQTGAQEKAPTREEIEDAIPEGAPKDDYGFVAWCHGALAGQIELDPIVEKDMDSIEGKAKAAKRHAEDLEIAKTHKVYLALYEKALVAAEKASPTAIHQQGVDAEVEGYKIWGPTRNKAPIWRMVDWGNWEVPPRCEKAAKRLYDRASLFGEALSAETAPAPPAAVATASSDPGTKPPVVADAPVKDAGAAPASAPPPGPAADAPEPGKTIQAPAADPKPGADGLRGPQ